MKKKILIIEDEDAYQKILSIKLASEGFDVMHAQNGEDGFDQAIKNHPDLIILDIQMPVMNGLEMLRKLRQDTWGKTVKVIIMSAFEEDNEVAHAVELNTFEYMVKSKIQLDEFIKKIKEETK